MILEYPNGEELADASETKILEAFEALDAKNNRLSLRRDPNELIGIIRHFHSRYYMVHSQRKKSSIQTKHPLPTRRAREVILAFVRGEEDWAENLQWESITLDNTRVVGPEIPVREQSTELLKRRLRLHKKLLWIAAPIFVLPIIVLVFLATLDDLHFWDADTFKLVAGVLAGVVPIIGSLAFLLRTRRKILRELERRGE